MLAAACIPALTIEPVERKTIEIGTASLGLTYLPVIIADRKGYFKDEGLNIEIAFPDGSKALEALMGGSLDMVSGGPGTHPVADFPIDLPRPREVSEIRLTRAFLELHTAIWQVLKKEVLKSHAHAQE